MRNRAIVEHKPDMIAIADHVVDMGPLAGAKGGEVVHQGSSEGLLASGTLTGRHIGKHQPIKDTLRKPSGEARVRDAALDNLRGVTVRVPLGVLVAVTGVAGSGKSSLVTGCLPRGREDVVVIGQALARGSRRSNAATYTGILDAVRKAFAKANGVEASLFSANSKGAPAPTAGARASTSRIWPPSTPWRSLARPARGAGSPPRCWSTACAAAPSPRSTP